MKNYLEQYGAGAESVCLACEQNITLASDGAWEDDHGACGCGDSEHDPDGNTIWTTSLFLEESP